MKEQQSIYIIPENFMGTMKVLQGSIRLRFLLDGIILGGLGAVIGWMIVFRVFLMTKEQGIPILLFLSAPGIMLGIVGIGGEAVSTVIGAYVQWMMDRKQYICDPVGVLFCRSPIEWKQEKERERDREAERWKGYLRKIRKKQRSLLDYEASELQVRPDDILRTYMGTGNRRTVTDIVIEMREEDHSEKKKKEGR